MQKLEQLEEKEQKALSRIERLKGEKKTALQAVFDNPDNDKAAMKAGALDMQIKAAEKCADMAAEAIEAEHERLESKEYKDAVKRLAVLEKEVAGIQQQQIEAAREHFPAYERWSELVKEHQNLARAHGIEVLDLWNRDAGEAGVRAIHEALQLWDGQRKRVEYQRRHHPERLK